MDRLDGSDLHVVENGRTSFEKFLNRVEVTREARFAANKRLTRRHKRAYYIISMLSLFVIIISILPNIFGLSDQQAQVLLAITILNSVFIIITTLMDAAGDYSLQAYLMQVSGRELSQTYNDIQLATDKQRLDPKWISSKQREYQAVLDRCPYDHDDADYLAVIIKKPGLFEHMLPESGINRKAYLLYLACRLHYLRARWWMPHVLMFIISLLIMRNFS